MGGKGPGGQAPVRSLPQHGQVMKDVGRGRQAGGIGHQNKAPAPLLLIGKGFSCEIHAQKDTDTHIQCNQLLLKGASREPHLGQSWLLFFRHHVETLGRS